jgi:hypothetical protein
MLESRELLCFSNDSVASMNRRASSVFEHLKNANPGISEETLSAMMDKYEGRHRHDRGDEKIRTQAVRPETYELQLEL